MLSHPLELASSVRRGVQRRSILIVEDDEAMAEVLSIRLDRQGFATTVAESGQSALKSVRAQKPDLILLDLCLPDMDGFEVCQALVDNEETCEIPVIILSGLERPDIIRRSHTAGCHYFVRKPYDPNALLTLIQQAMDEAKES